MTVRHFSTDRLNSTLFASAKFAFLMLLALGLMGQSAAFAEDVPEPAAPPAQSDGDETPEAAPAETPPEAAEPAANAEPAAQAEPPKEDPPTTPTPAVAAEGEEKPPATENGDTPAAEEPPEETAPVTEEAAAKVEEATPLPPKPEPATEDASAMPAEEGVTAADEAAPLPPKPAESDVLESVLPTPEGDAATVEPAMGEMPEQPPLTDTPATPLVEDAEEVMPSEPELDLPADVEAAMDEFMAEGDQPTTLRFTFRYQPWEEVLQWFADQSDLSLIMDAPPTGTFNYTDNRSYSPAEAIDLLNSVLLTKGYTLVRRERMLMVFNLQDGIPDNLVTTIPLEELDERGEFELVGVLFQLTKFDPEEAATEIERLIGPQGRIDVLPKTRQLYVRETAGRLRTIRSVIQRVEDPMGLASGKLESYEFKNVLPDEGLMVLRQLLDIPVDANATEDDSFRFALDPMGMRLLFSGAADKIAKAREILEAVDVSTGDGETPAEMEQLQLEVYPIAVADPESVLKVMQTLLEGLPGVRLSIDPKTGSLVALARPTNHATILATIDQMQSETRRIEVIYLQRVDPQVAAISIKRMFGSPDDDEENKISTAPTVEADPAGRQLIVHGTENQIAQIRVLLGKMGETEFADGPLPTGSRIRILQTTGRSAETALQNLRMIWPTISDNPIKEVTPSAIIPSLGPQETIPSRVPGKRNEPLTPRRPDPASMPGGIPGLHRPSDQPQASPAAATEEDRQTSHSHAGLFRFATQTEQSEEPEAAEESPSDQPAEAPAENASSTPAEPEQTPEAPDLKAPIIISHGPNGLMIASDDLEALDEFERLFNSMTGGADSDRTELNIFYLKYAKATVVSETLTKIIGSGTTGSATAAEDSILGQLMGGTMGALLNLGASTLSPTGMLRITAEPRLNALIVEANAADLRTIEEVLKLLDQPESPEEVLVTPRARLIPVYNMAADEVADMVKVVFADKMQGASGRSSGGGSQPSSPADFFAAMRGGRGGSTQRGGNTSSAAKEEPERMTVGVDARSNSLIVFASQSVHEEVAMLVEELDSIASVADDEATEMVTLSNLNPEAMKAALMAIMGENAISNSTSSSSNRSSTSRTTSSRTGSSGQTGGVSDDMRRRIEMMRSMMGGRGGAPGGGTTGGRGGGGPGGGGRGGR